MNESIKFLGKVYQRNQDIVCRKIADETILVPICGNVADMQMLFMLNPVAEFVWQHLEGNATLESIRVDIVENFDVSRAESGKDIVDFVLELQKLDLICEVDMEKKSV
ncbi:MAG: PqqD family protein [Desulfobacteraceae bacterium]|jgi:hypothetical protein|nr:PqqD family protein [Desulfobacteraceae bacterium]